MGLFEAGEAGAGEEAAGSAGGQDLFGAEFEFGFDGEYAEGDDESFAAESPAAERGGEGDVRGWRAWRSWKRAAEYGEAEGR